MKRFVNDLLLKDAEFFIVTLQGFFLTMTDTCMQSAQTAHTESSFLSKLHYSYLSKFRSHISSFSGSVSLTDMLKFEKTMKDPQLELYDDYYSHRKRGVSFFGFILRKFKTSFALQLFLAFMSMSAQAMLAIVFQLLIKELISEVRDQNNTLLYFIALVMVMLLLTYVNSHHFLTGCMMNVGFRFNIIKLINQKIFTLSSYKISQLTKFKLLNIVSSDTSPIESMIYYFSYPILAPIFLAIHIAIYWISFGPASLVGVAGTFVFWPWMVCEAKMTQKYVDKRNNASDRRLSLVQELVEKIRFVKMSGQSRSILEKIKKARATEDKYSRRIGYLSWSTFAVTKLAPVFSFMPMVLVYYLQGGELTLDKIFMALLLLNYTKMTLVFFTKSGIAFITEFRAACKRCQEIMDTQSDKTQQVHPPPHDSNNAVEVNNYTAWWSDTTHHSALQDNDSSIIGSQPVLKDLTFDIKKASLTMALGRVGSGKSSLLSAILQDIPRTEGDIRGRGKNSRC